MDYEEFDDGELFMLVCEDDETAKEVLYNKYKYIIDIIVKKYSLNAKNLGVEYKDLYGESLLGFTDAINNYDANRETSLKTFISMCVNSRLQKVILHAKTKKNMINKEAFSLEHTYEDGATLEEILSDNEKNDPLRSMVDEESTNETIESIKNELSELEKQVFDLLINGFNYLEIAKILDKTPKQIDNSIQRMKSKAKKILNKSA